MSNLCNCHLSDDELLETAKSALSTLPKRTKVNLNELNEEVKLRLSKQCHNPVQFQRSLYKVVCMNPSEFHVSWSKSENAFKRESVVVEVSLT
jgi:hypothetical protein